NLVMRRALGCLFFGGLCMFGQSTPAFIMDSILSAMRDPGASRASLSPQLAGVIFSMAQRDHQPSRGAVLAFTDELIGALIGKDVKWNARPRWLFESVTEILSTSGANFTKASRLGDTLKALGVDESKTHSITTSFIKIGEEVR